MTRVATSALGWIEAAAMAFVRVGASRRAPFVSVVARARFRIVPGEIMRIMAPAPLVVRPTYSADGRLVEPGDHAPYLPRAELLVLCKATVPAPRPARVMISRGGAKLLAKSFVLEGFASLGPQLRAIPPEPDGPLLELGEAFDFHTHQTAPADQLLEYFQGGESIVLDQLARHPRLQTWLPAATPVARLYSLGGGPTTAPFALAMDRLVLDLDTLTATLLMRACAPLASEADVGRVGAVAAFDAASADWPLRFETAVAAPAFEANATMMLEPGALAHELLGGDVPFVSGASAPPAIPRRAEPVSAPSFGSGTLSLDEVRLVDLLAAEAQALAAGSTIVADDPGSSVVGATLPFRSGPPSLESSPRREPEGRSLAGSTLAVDMSLADVLGHAALPFGSPSASTKADDAPASAPPPPLPLPLAALPLAPAPLPPPPPPVAPAPERPRVAVDEAPAAPPPPPERRLSPSEKLAARAAARKREKG